MATNTCTSCGCKKCGCSDNGLISPAPCPTPAGCPTPLTCSEVFDAECVSYTGVDIECLNQVVVATDTNLADALDNIISFFCQYIAAAAAGNIVEVCDTNDYLSISSTLDPVTGVTTYTVCFDPTNLPEVTLSGGTGINVTSNVVGNITTYTVTNTDLGSSQNIFKNIAVPSQSTIIADSNNDTLTLAAGSGISITTNAITDTITITNTGSGGQNLWQNFVADVGTSTANTPTDTFTIVGSKDITTNIIGDTLTIKTWDYEIGEYVASEGGVVFYRWLSATAGGYPGNGSVQNYLVVDTTDLSSSSEYATLSVNIPNVESTWDGDTNTINLIAAGAGSGIVAGTAAVLCNSSTNNGKTDWYLPSIDELNKLYQSRWETEQGLIAASGVSMSFSVYWSSTETNIVSAWYFSYDTGAPATSQKTASLQVRAIRKFNT